LAAVTWVGGSIFLVVVLAPALRAPELRSQAPALIRGAGRRFRKLTYAAFVTFLGTGAVLLAHRGFALTPLLAGRLALVAGAFAVSGIHDFWAGPAAALAARRGDATASAHWRSMATWLGRLNLVLTLTIVTLSVAIARGD